MTIWIRQFAHVENLPSITPYDQKSFVGPRQLFSLIPCSNNPPPTVAELQQLFVLDCISLPMYLPLPIIVNLPTLDKTTLAPIVS